LKSLTTKRPDGFVYGETIHHDATTPWPEHIDQLDAIITSPPFFDSTRFYLANWMRLWMAGWTAQDFKTQPNHFVDEMQKRTMDVYTPILKQAKERLRDGGVCVFHLGDSKKCNMAVEIERLARPIFKRSETFAESVKHCESHGIRDKGTVTSHTYLVLS
jgi:tRNA G10  N-methylase Trm11